MSEGNQRKACQFPRFVLRVALISLLFFKNTQIAAEELTPLFPTGQTEIYLP